MPRSARLADSRRFRQATSIVVTIVAFTDGPDTGDLRWSRPSPRLRVLRRWEVAAGTLTMIVAAVVAAVLIGSRVFAAIAVVGLAVVGLAADRVAGRRVRAWAYAERSDDLLVTRGVMFRRMSVIPYGRMQYVEVTAGPFERAFGLATVQMHTAAAASDGRIPGLPAEEASRLRDQLTSLGEAHAMGL
jgi:membrane protein YdbS with pleckstrin-like domain